MFKADGEIVVNMARSGPSSSSSSSHFYALQVGQPAPIYSAAARPSGPAAAEGPTATAAAAVKEASQRVRLLKEQLAAAHQQAATADEQLKAARGALLLHQQQLAAAEKLVERLTQHQQVETQKATKLLPSLQQQLAVANQQQQLADQALAAAAGELDQALQKQQELLQQLQDLAGPKANRGSSSSSRAQKAITRSKAAGCYGIFVGSGSDALGMLSLSEAAEKLAAADAAVAEVWMQADKAREQQRRAGSRAAALRKELQKVQKAAGDEQEVEKLQVCWLACCCPETCITDAASVNCRAVKGAHLHICTEWLSRLVIICQQCR